MMAAGTRASISVVLTTFNGSRTVAAAIGSVLEQSAPPLEVVVVDDGSTDESVALASRFGPPVRVFAHPHRGVASALNEAIRNTSGDCLAFIDQDDLWSRDKLSLQMAVLAANPEIEAVFGHVGQFSDHDYTIQSVAQVGSVQRFAGIKKLTMLIRRTAFDRIGPFDPLFSADFIEWYGRALGYNLRSVVLDDIVAFRRVHDKNTTRMRRKIIFGDYLRIARMRARQNERMSSIRKACPQSTGPKETR